MILYKADFLKFILMCYAVCFPLDDVLAAKKTCSVGQFLFSTVCRDCKPGCYCTGGGTETISLDPDNKIKADVLEAYCKHERDECPKGNKNGGEEYGACGRHNNAKIYRCPDDFPNSSSKSTSQEQCYTTVGSKKLYYKKITCSAGKYLPINSESCVSCKSGERYYCPGSGSFYPSTKGDQGIKECPSNKIANSQKSSCIDSTIKCVPGQYLPKNATKCTSCKSGRYYVCDGGSFPTKPSSDQGIRKCDGNMVADSEHKQCVAENNSKTIIISKNQMKFGFNGNNTPVESQCWTKYKYKSEYISCVLKRYY